MTSGAQPAAARLTSEHIGYHYDPSLAPVLTLAPGSEAIFDCLDARAGALLDREVGSLFELPLPTPGKSNPITGPLAIEGAEPGDALVVDVLDIDVISPGWGGGHAYVNPLWPGRVPRPLGRITEVRDGVVHFSDGISFPARPMLGCIGVATRKPDADGVDQPVHAGWAGRYGGNLDQKVLNAGTRLYLPVFFPGALLYIGDVHAAQGDGELSGTAIEIGATVRVRVNLVKGGAPRWPWLESEDRWIVMTADHDFVIARREAVDAVISVLERDLGMEPAEALALLAGAGDLRVGQSMGGAIPMTLRLEIPKWDGVQPVRAGVPG